MISQLYDPEDDNGENTLSNTHSKSAKNILKAGSIRRNDDGEEIENNDNEVVNYQYKAVGSMDRAIPF